MGIPPLPLDAEQTLQTSSPKVVEHIPMQGVDERFLRMDLIIQ